MIKKATKKTYLELEIDRDQEGKKEDNDKRLHKTNERQQTGSYLRRRAYEEPASTRGGNNRAIE